MRKRVSMIPPWGWKTDYQVIDKDDINITAYNITPDAKEAKDSEIESSRFTEQAMTLVGTA